MMKKDSHLLLIPVIALAVALASQLSGNGFLSRMVATVKTDYLIGAVGYTQSPPPCLLRLRLKEFIRNYPNDKKPAGKAPAGEPELAFSLFSAVEHRGFDKPPEQFYPGEEADYALETIGATGNVLNRYALFSTLFPIVESPEIIILEQGIIEVDVPFSGVRDIRINLNGKILWKLTNDKKEATFKYCNNIK